MDSSSFPGEVQQSQQQQQLREYQAQLQQHSAHQLDALRSPLPDSFARSPTKHHPPARSLTVGTANELDRKNTPSNYDVHPHARSEDLNHGRSDNLALSSSPSGSPMPAFHSLSRPLTPNDKGSGASSSNHSEDGSGKADDSTLKRSSVASLSSAPSGVGSKATGNASGASGSAPTICAACSLPLEGAFVRALGNVWHLPCFKCRDCDAVVASKFFPIEGPDGKQQPLCERDYFRRLNLICAKCDQALRGSYITACNKKYHVEHFTCSVCPTVFGPQDSYYEHENDVYCHFHYSTRFATKCAGCNSAILKQFVEINRNNRDECWHPECYMINKFWNVKISSRRPTSSNTSAIDVSEEPWKEEEEKETAQSLKNKQVRMEQQVYRIWTVLSAFEESSAACISDMLRQVSNGQYLDAIRMAEKFILHVEVLFATIDDLETCFSRLNLKGMSHVREARLLCRKTVDLFTLLSKPQDNQRRTGMTQDLLALVTGLAHYLKILIRIALTGSLKLERDHSVREAMTNFLDKLHLLAVEGGNPGARRVIRGGERHTGDLGGADSTHGVTYGFKSLAPELAGESPFSDSPDSTVPLVERLSIKPPSDLCAKCDVTVEEDCARLGTYQRWHSHCLQCSVCGKASAPPIPKETPRDPGSDDKEAPPPKVSTVRRAPANVDIFVYEPQTAKDSPYGPVPTVIFCLDHQRAGSVGGFQAVTRLEQYAFLLNVALRRLSYLLKRRGVLIPPTPSATVQPQPNDSLEQQSYLDSGNIPRMKAVHLDRKQSATARLPRHSTIIESPSGKTAQPTSVANVTTQRNLVPPAQAQSAMPSAAQARLMKPAQPSGIQGPPTSPLPQQQSQPGRPRLAAPGALPGGLFDDRGQALRPGFARNNTGVMIIDESAPNSPSGGIEDPPIARSDDGITLADIPQLIEAEEARKQHRALPSQSTIPLIAELTPLELMIVKHAALLALSRSPLKNEFELDDLLEYIEVKKGGFWNKFFKKDKQKKGWSPQIFKLVFSDAKSPAGVFGVPLEILIEKEAADSALGASRAATLRVPSFIDDVISAMRQMDMSVEGIFRKNGNIRRLNELTEAIDRDPSSVDLTQDNPVQLAALLKKFLKSLPEPLMTYKLYRLFMAAENLPNEIDRIRCLHLVMLMLPKGNRDTVEVLFTFLKWVASFSHVDEETGNRMDLHNLATVISPNIFRSSPTKGNDTVRVESFESIRVMDSLLEHQDEFYLVPEEFLPLLHDQEYFGGATELPSKEFLKKCDAYHRVRANGRTPQGLTSPVLGSGSQGMTPSGSGSYSNMTRDASDPRLATHRSDPSMTRGRQLYGEPGTPGAGGRNGYFTQDLPQGPSSSGSPSEQPPPPIRNGHSSRQQSPQPQPRLPHQPFSHPGTNGPLPTAQNFGFAAQDLERGGGQQQSQQQWMQSMALSGPTPQQQNQGPSFTPSTSPRSYTPRTSGELVRNNFAAPNGHAPSRT
ncbi:RhoGAP-domain-containing protein [Fomitiporia mediterranea MF3/22]|uniref:RhoGAP-domain-containing protein n=1 Tax=Fomitiporia mediterranea (strain MF3/22) TaxID=694068 RepID=UPI0004408D81|nr:RhoGAP-domain-containing protein [Fomitiporia mediterranea MF3/22]EJD07623.1 RhoGAP-domain-containing protein [Fomitiporia mediterranea MF3/22]